MNLKRKYLIMAAVLALAVSIASMPLYSTAAKTSRRGIDNNQIGRASCRERV